MLLERYRPLIGRKTWTKMTNKTLPGAEEATVKPMQATQILKLFPYATNLYF